MADIWIINGIPGAGKTTIAAALAGRFERSAHIEGDRLQTMIVAGSVPPGQMPAEEECRQIELNVRNQCLLARSFVDAGFDALIDYVLVSRSRLGCYRDLLAGLAIHLVTLAPGIEMALERDRRRPEKTVASAWTHLDHEMRLEMGGIGLWVDNSSLTVDETVDYILTNRSELEYELA